MATNTIEAFYVGVFADLDPNESNWTVENEAVVLGQTFGSPGAPLHDSIDALTLHDTNNDGVTDENDRGQTAEDMTYGGISSGLDSVMDIDVTLTYADGTTVTTEMALLQDVSRRVFLAPYPANQSLDDELHAEPIQSITIDSLNYDDYEYVLTALNPDGFIDGDVDGTSGDDTMTSTHVDGDGTEIDGDDGPVDLIYGHAGNDTIDAGAGNDTVYGGIGDDIIAGGDGNDLIVGGEGNDTMVGGAGNDTIVGDTPLAAGMAEYLVQGFVKGDSFTLTNDHLGSAGDTELTIDTAPIQIRFVDNDNTLDGDDTVNETPDDADSLIEINGELYSFAADFQQEFSGDDGNTYTFIIVDVDIDGDGTFDPVIEYGDFVTDVDGDQSYENGQILLPVGTPPPPGVALTATGTITAVGSISYDSLYGAEAVTYDDVLDGGAGDDTLIGGFGDDTFLAGTNNGGGDIYVGDEGTDTYQIDGTSVEGIAHNVDLAAGTDQNGNTFSSIENVIGGDANDTISGDSANNTFEGRGGDDILSGKDGDDVIYGDSTATPPAASTEALNWDAEGLDEADLSAGFTQNTGQMDVTFTVTQEANFDAASVETSATQYVDSGVGEPFNPNSSLQISGTGTGDTATATIDFSSATAGVSDEVENISFHINDIDVDGFQDILTITALDAAGNPVTVNITLAGNDSLSGNTITGAGGTNDSSDSAQGSALIEIPGPVQSIVIDYDNGDSASQLVYITDVHFDTLPMAEGNDTIDGGIGDDTLFGGGGDDTIIGGVGSDTMSGGTGGDTFVLKDGSGTDIISDFDVGDDDGDGFYNDQFDVSGLTDAAGNPVNAWDVVVTDDGSGNAKLTFPNGESVVLEGVAPGQIDTAPELFAAGIPCFTSGALITTPKGETPVENLAVGDMVMTMDSGAQPIAWMGKRHLGEAELAANPHLKPIHIGKGVLGNYSPLLVSPLHGMFLNERQGLKHECLVRAKHLVETPGPVRIANGRRSVEYIHLMLDKHEVIFANGAPSESFYPGFEALNMLSKADLATLHAQFPKLEQCPPKFAYGSRARPFLRRNEVLSMVRLTASREHISVSGTGFCIPNQGRTVRPDRLPRSA